MLAMLFQYPFNGAIQSHYNDTLPAVSRGSKGNSTPLIS